MKRDLIMKKTKKRKLSPAQIAQRQNAWAKALEGMKVNPDKKTRKKGENSKPIKDGYAHMKLMKDLVRIEPGIVDEGQKPEDSPLWHIYRNAIIDVTQSPLMYLSKTAARLEVAIAKQMLKDQAAGIPISKEMLAATKVAMEAVKIAQRADTNIARTGRGRRMVGKDDDEIVIDSEAFESK